MEEKIVSSYSVLFNLQNECNSLRDHTRRGVGCAYCRCRRRRNRGALRRAARQLCFFKISRSRAGSVARPQPRARRTLASRRESSLWGSRGLFARLEQTRAPSSASRPSVWTATSQILAP